MILILAGGTYEFQDQNCSLTHERNYIYCHLYRSRHFIYYIISGYVLTKQKGF